MPGGKLTQNTQRMVVGVEGFTTEELFSPKKQSLAV